MDNTKHKHIFTEDNNYLICECGKKKLKLQQETSTTMTGMRSKNLKYTVRNNRERIFSPKEWKIFYDALKPFQRFTFKFLLITGARINEARNVKVEDIDLKNNRLILRVTKRLKEHVSNKSHTRTLRISTELVKDIRARIKELELKEEDYIKILSTPAANICLKKTLNEVGIKDYQMFSIHNIRKTSENWALTLGVDSMKLSKRYGHNLITMYMHYSQSEAYSYEERDMIKDIFGDTFLE